MFSFLKCIWLLESKREIWKEAESESDLPISYLLPKRLETFYCA